MLELFGLGDLRTGDSNTWNANRNRLGKKSRKRQSRSRKPRLDENRGFPSAWRSSGRVGNTTSLPPRRKVFGCESLGHKRPRRPPEQAAFRHEKTRIGAAGMTRIGGIIGPLASPRPTAIISALDQFGRQESGAISGGPGESLSDHGGVAQLVRALARHVPRKFFRAAITTGVFSGYPKFINPADSVNSRQVPRCQCTFSALNGLRCGSTNGARLPKAWTDFIAILVQS